MKILLAISKLMSDVQQLGVNKFCKQKNFALESGINDSNLGKMLRVPNGIELRSFFRLCRALRIQPWTLLYMSLNGHFDFTEEDDKGWELKG